MEKKKRERKKREEKKRITEIVYRDTSQSFSCPQPCSPQVGDWIISPGELDCPKGKGLVILIFGSPLLRGGF